MPAGLGGSGYVGIAFETTMGTYVAPTIWVPIIDESLQYQEDKYYSPQIRQQVLASDVKPSFYSVAGDITLEVDKNNIMYFLHASRHTIAKADTAGVAPYTYTYTPATAGSATTAAGATTRKTLSILIVRNGVGFGYAGCVLGGYSFTIEDGVLRATLNVLGLSEATQAIGSPAWSAPVLYGADSHNVYVDAAGAAPAFATASADFNGFTFNADHNAEPQNRIRSQRSASYISYGETEASYDTELDFIDKTEYDNFKASTKRAVRLLSTDNGGTLTSATHGVQIDVNNSVYDTYEVGLGGMGDLIMAGVTGRALAIAGGDAYSIKVKTNVNIV